MLLNPSITKHFSEQWNFEITFWNFDHLLSWTSNVANFSPRLTENFPYLEMSQSIYIS